MFFGLVKMGEYFYEEGWVGVDILGFDVGNFNVGYFVIKCLWFIIVVEKGKLYVMFFVVDF